MNKRLVFYLFSFIIFCSSNLFAERVDRALLWIKNLDHDIPLVRKNAAFYLGRMHEKRAVKPLLSAINDEDNGVKIQVIKSLGLIGDYSIIDELRRIYGKEREDVRRILLAVIGRLEKIKEKEEKKNSP